MHGEDKRRHDHEDREERDQEWREKERQRPPDTGLPGGEPTVPYEEEEEREPEH
jgi:hypothetical protein